ncbi:mitochondrial protein [Teratosphaeria destructans]|uniref:Mitochondrial protein n=1 Tax=Teratosphaeria destructans TaxID=418781 RepID=A0A9W7SWU7_9PEZI|nr:mitochondrial protein [Teratosphaeria destructans]
MPSSCKDIRAALAACLQSSDCVLVHRNTPSTCLRDPALSAALPTTCHQLIRGYGECKRGQIDMRKRFRGNKPIASRHRDRAGGGEKGTPVEVPMLYAGKGSGGGVRATDGREGPADVKRADGGGGEWEVFVRNDGTEDLRRK